MYQREISPGLREISGAEGKEGERKSQTRWNIEIIPTMSGVKVRYRKKETGL